MSALGLWRIWTCASSSALSKCKQFMHWDHNEMTELLPPFSFDMFENMYPNSAAFTNTFDKFLKTLKKNIYLLLYLETSSTPRHLIYFQIILIFPFSSLTLLIIDSRCLVSSHPTLLPRPLDSLTLPPTTSSAVDHSYLSQNSTPLKNLLKK